MNSIFSLSGTTALRLRLDLRMRISSCHLRGVKVLNNLKESQGIFGLGTMLAILPSFFD